MCFLTIRREKEHLVKRLTELFKEGLEKQYVIFGDKSLYGALCDKCNFSITRHELFCKDTDDIYYEMKYQLKRFALKEHYIFLDISQCEDVADNAVYNCVDVLKNIMGAENAVIKCEPY